MNVAIFGATGMVGRGVLIECLEDPDIARVLVVVRRPTGMKHGKLTEIVHADFLAYTAIEDKLSGLDACFFLPRRVVCGDERGRPKNRRWGRPPWLRHDGFLFTRPFRVSWRRA